MRSGRGPRRTGRWSADSRLSPVEKTDNFKFSEAKLYLFKVLNYCHLLKKKTILNFQKPNFTYLQVLN